MLLLKFVILTVLLINTEILRITYALRAILAAQLALVEVAQSVCLVLCPIITSLLPIPV